MLEKSASVTLLLPWPTRAKKDAQIANDNLRSMLRTYVEMRKAATTPSSDAIDLLLSKGMPVDRIVNRIYISITASWILIFLASNLPWKTKVLAEINAAMEKYASDSTEPIRKRLATIPLSAWEEEMPMVDLVLQETLRLTVAGVVPRRNICDDIEILGKRVPKGCFVVYQTEDVHMDPEVYENPTQFDPARFQSGREEHKKVTYAFLSWGAGRHSCPGMKFAKLDLKLMVTLFLTTYEYDLVNQNGASLERTPKPNYEDFQIAQPTEHVFYKFKRVLRAPVKTRAEQDRAMLDTAFKSLVNTGSAQICLADPDASKVQYRRLGKCGLRVSVPISWILEEEASFKILQAAWEMGINTFDTANVYSNGESERIIGNIPRERLIITSKCWNIVGDDPGVQWSPTQELRDKLEYVNQGGLCRAAIFNAIDASLKRLQLDYIDLYQIHRFDPYTPVEESMKALHDLVESGKVRYIGACNLRTWQFALMNEVAEKRGWTKFVSMQSQYSLLYREEEREMNAYCNYHGIGIIPYGALAKGLLARPAGVVTPRTQSNKGTVYEAKATAAGQEIINRVQEVAEKRGIKMGQVALAWIQTKVASPVVGVSTMTQLLESAATDIQLTDEEIMHLEQVYIPQPYQGFD
ncbi:hypothetical protein DXG01_016583 [Tephrocybe rancida]|nr:hypothetical protein DXG01_016583 [Tephrocybe rancida]